MLSRALLVRRWRPYGGQQETSGGSQMVYPPRSQVIPPKPKQARRGSIVLVAVLTTGAGALSAVAAAHASGPFAGLHPAPIHLVQRQVPAAPLDASALYPAPTPAVIHKVVDMYDLPVAPKAAITAPEVAPSNNGHSEGGHPEDGNSKDTHSGAHPSPPVRPSPPANSSPSPSPSPGGDG
jgi:hypothetical protein